ncbi:MAG: nitroreductase family protein [Alistipes sp.]|nr:nitroreductase family protein [Alistipes sp.]
MADNYLGKKMEDHYSATPVKSRKSHPSLLKLLQRNRSHRAYDVSFQVREDQLRRIIEVNRYTPSARNQQVLRFRMVLSDEAEKVLPHIRLGAALPELNLPQKGSEPRAFIIICSTVEESRFVDIDLGIAAQSMLLQATEIGLNGICIAAFDKQRIKEQFNLPYEPLMILAIGRGKDNIVFTEIKANESHNYYRKDGIHYVPKLSFEELIIK